MLKSRGFQYFGSAALVSVSCVIAGGQGLPCWKTTNTSTKACDVWLEENPFVACWTDFTLNDVVKRASSAASPWSDPIIQYAECYGPYKIKDENGNCTIKLTLSGWQTTGTQGGGGPCPSGGGGGS